MDLQTALKIFGINTGQSGQIDLDQIKTIYRTKARRCHPDVNKNPDAVSLMQELNDAYAVLENNYKPHPETSINKEAPRPSTVSTRALADAVFQVGANSFPETPGIYISEKNQVSAKLEWLKSVKEGKNNYPDFGSFVNANSLRYGSLVPQQQQQGFSQELANIEHVLKLEIIGVLEEIFTRKDFIYFLQESLVEYGNIEDTPIPTVGLSQFGISISKADYFIDKLIERADNLVETRFFRIDDENDVIWEEIVSLSKYKDITPLLINLIRENTDTGRNVDSRVQKIFSQIKSAELDRVIIQLVDYRYNDGHIQYNLDYIRSFNQARKFLFKTLTKSLIRDDRLIFEENHVKIKSIEDPSQNIDFLKVKLSTDSYLSLIIQEIYSNDPESLATIRDGNPVSYSEYFSDLLKSNPSMSILSLAVMREDKNNTSFYERYINIIEEFKKLSINENTFDDLLTLVKNRYNLSGSVEKGIN